MLRKGIYRHMKHDPLGVAHNFTYEVLGVAKHTETGEECVVYRPLYKNDFLGNANFFMRPLEMFLGFVEHEGKRVPRFTFLREKE